MSNPGSEHDKRGRMWVILNLAQIPTSYGSVLDMWSLAPKAQRLLHDAMPACLLFVSFDGQKFHWG